MNNTIITPDNNNLENENLIKENTPEAVDYNKLYNIQNSNDNNFNNQNINNNVQNSSVGNNNVIPNNNTLQNNNLTNNEYVMPTIQSNQTIQTNNKTEKKKSNGLLFVGAVFVILMGIIVFLFPFIAKYLL